MQPDTPVLIVGGGPIGLATALELAYRGVRSVLVPFMGSSHDTLALDLAGQIGRNAKARVNKPEPHPISRTASVG